MEFFDVLKTRVSIRKYKPDPISEEILIRILESTNRAPSAGNLQAFEIYVVRDEDQRLRLSRAALDQGFIREAPVVLIFCANPHRSEWKYKRRGANLYSIQDATIACTFAMLTATALDLSSVWVGAFDENEVKNIINAPDGERPVALLPIGYAAEISIPRPRRPLIELVHFV
jgi:nitroreductase